MNAGPTAGNHQKDLPGTTSHTTAEFTCDWVFQSRQIHSVILTTTVYFTNVWNVVFRAFFPQNCRIGREVMVVATRKWFLSKCSISLFRGLTCTCTGSFCWWVFLLARPAERTGEDIDIILSRLKNVKAFERFHPSLLQQICLCGFYECLEKGITRKPAGARQRRGSLMITISVCWAESKAVLSQCTGRETSAPAGTPSSLVRWTSKCQRPQIIR